MNKSNSYQVHQGQSWLDVSLKLYGTPVYAFDLAIANNSTITDEIPAGTMVLFDPELKQNKTILIIYNNNKTNPATAFSTEDKQILERLEGISIWTINLDFQVVSD